MPSVASPASTPIARTRGSAARRISAGVKSGYANSAARAAVWRRPARKNAGRKSSAAAAAAGFAIGARRACGAGGRTRARGDEERERRDQNAHAKHAPRAAFKRRDVPAPRTGAARS